jgi:hypothetical protein
MQKTECKFNIFFAVNEICRLETKSNKTVILRTNLSFRD